MDWAFTYAMTTPLTTEENYPYTAHCLKPQCAYTGNGIVSVLSYADVAPNDSKALKNAIAVGPVSVAIAANSVVFQTYRAGVLTSLDCGTKTDHGVLAVGYGSQYGYDYILVKNSWGADWGDDGYVKIGVADGEGICGINTSPSIPVTN